MVGSIHLSNTNHMINLLKFEVICPFFLNLDQNVIVYTNIFNGAM